jgi:ADP-dependent NAD(P)H-hydrate dehydratase / NAD(P)H-hydrate epimerase
MSFIKISSNDKNYLEKLPMKLVSVEQMITLEKEANAGGLLYDQMMRNAGFALAGVIHENFWANQEKRIVGLIGSGNNGGDALIALGELSKKGWKVSAYLVKERDPDDALVLQLEQMNCNVIQSGEDPKHSKLFKLIEKSDLILDGILGTGVKLPLKPDVSDILKAISKIDKKPITVAVDCPSGVDCENGEAAEETLYADLTVCMAAVKAGLLKFPAFEFIGKLIVVDIGLPPNLPGFSQTQSVVVDHHMAKALLPDRPLNAHKGTFGKCMVVGGSVNYCGAVVLAAQSAYKIGAGLVCAAIPGSIYDAIAGQVPECIWVMLPDSVGVINSNASPVLQQNLKRVDALLIGPGLGQEKETFDFICNLLLFNNMESNQEKLGFSHSSKNKKQTRTHSQPPIVFDADALRHLASIEDWHKLLEKVAVLTPHPGEMSALTGLSIEEIQKDREATAKKYAEKWGHVVVLKGAITVIAAPDGTTFFIPIATPALATAGTGDVLAGMIVGLISQGCSALNAAVAGAWFHAQAGIAAEKNIGQNISVMAGDVVRQIPNALK